MNRTLPPFDPPSRPRGKTDSFPAYLAQLEQWLDRYQNYTKDYLSQLASVVNTGAQGFSLTNITAAPTIDVGAYTSLVVGTTTIDTIHTSQGFSGQIHLIAVDGFSTGPGGNIASVVAVPADGSVLLDFNPVTQLWYPNI